MSNVAVGTAGFGNVFNEVSQAEVSRAVAAAIERGVNYFDTAPFYGLGLAESRLGEALRQVGSPPVRVSTKVGRTLDSSEAGWHFDFSRDAILRQLEASLDRLGLEKVDTLLLHDPDDHRSAVYESAWPTLVELRDSGVVGLIGIGTNKTAFATELVHAVDVDVVLIAGRYTLLDCSAAAQLLPACEENGTAIVLAGVFNSGILADPSSDSWFDYQTAPKDLVERAREIQRISKDHGYSLAHVALQFAAKLRLGHETLVGVRSAEEFEANYAFLRRPIHAPLWRDLQLRGLLPPEALLDINVTEGDRGEL